MARATSMSLLVAALVPGCGVPGQTPAQFDGDQALSYVKTQVEFGPRVPNTNGHRLAGTWILELLRERADSVEVQTFTHVTVDGDTLQLRNFLARFLPDRPDRVLFVAHWDTRPRADAEADPGRRELPVPGANDGASGVAILLGIADQLRTEPPAFGVDLLFVDGEDYGDFSTDKDVLLGSRYFAANLPEGYEPLFGVLFDIVGDANPRFPKEWHSVNGAPEVVDRVWRRADDLGWGRYFLNQTGRAVTDDHIPLLDAGLRVIDVIQLPLPEYWHTTADTVDKISARTLEMVGSVAVSLVG